jgi:hypothetical protein
VKEDGICLICADYCLFFGRDDQKTLERMQEIQDAGFERTIEEDVCGFLGFKVKFDSTTSTFTLTQTGLIKKIISLYGQGGHLPPLVQNHP